MRFDLEERIALAAMLLLAGCSSKAAPPSGDGAPADGDAGATGAMPGPFAAADPVAADGHCLESIVDREDVVPVGADVACTLARARYRHDDMGAMCKSACGKSDVTTCYVGDTYWFSYVLGASDPSACPDVDGGTVDITCAVTHLVETESLPPCGNGRRPRGLERPEPERHTDSVASWLAMAARLEAASVTAFRALALELHAHGAPSALVARAESAAEDEIRHAAAMGSLARRRGAFPTVPRSAPFVQRTLGDLAADNAAEGVVRETYGAAVALLGAKRAAESDVRRALVTIAREELGHAALALRIAQWARPRLNAEERALHDRALVAAVAELRREIASTEPDAALRAAVGLPSAAEGLALVDLLFADLQGFCVKSNALAMSATEASRELSGSRPQRCSMVARIDVVS